ncbi:MAG: TIGR03620 family F420-dependent LLM class oxidoreductase [Actinomycetota bacterium]
MSTQARDQLGQFGIWRNGGQLSPDLAIGIERAGFGALWVGGSPDGDLDIVEELLAATTTLTLGTSIVNIWKDGAPTVAASFARIEARFAGRFVLGVGTGHREATQQYEKPYAKLASYVTDLLNDGVPAGSLVLAALGPKVLELARDTTAGAIPYLVTPEHTRRAREILGAGPLLAPEHKVVLDADPVSARAIGRPRVQNPYLGLINYTSNLRRLGWTEEDLADGGSDALIDALVAHGSPADVAAQLHEHLAAGADHVVAQLLTGRGDDLLDGYAQLGSALGLS